MYGPEETAHLSGRDKRLGAAIERIGPIERPVNPDLFTALVQSIVEQQISTKAAETVWGRLVSRIDIEPEALADADAADIQACGISWRKTAYVQGIARAVASGALDLGSLSGMDDEEVVRTLVAWPGVGVWTAEMLLIFSLGRPDVVSWSDLAIRRGMTRLYGHRELTKERFARYRKRYAPHGSVASLYLWTISAE
jgi:DNA-3-methyladenine glycosylase II